MQAGMTEIFNKPLQTGKRKSLRKEMLGAEVVLWGYLRNNKLEGIKFRRQYGIGKYIVDFYSPQV